jgi:hypothetical protein
LIFPKVCPIGPIGALSAPYWRAETAIESSIPENFNYTWIVAYGNTRALLDVCLGASVSDRYPGVSPGPPPGTRAKGEIADRGFVTPQKPGDETSVSDLALGAGPEMGPGGTPGHRSLPDAPKQTSSNARNT